MSERVDAVPANPKVQPLLSIRHVRSLALGVALILVWAVSRPSQDDPSNYLGFGLIVLVAVLPSVFWAIRVKKYAVPLLPLYAICFLWTGAMPLLDAHPLVLIYPPADRLFAASVVCAHLLAAFAAWLLFWRRPVMVPKNIWVVRAGVRSGYYYGIMFVAVLYEILYRIGALNFIAELLPITRAVAGSAMLLSTLLLAFRIGKGESDSLRKFTYYGLLLVYCVVTSSSLLLVTAIIMIGVTIFGLTLSSGRIPWLLLAITMPILAVLHLGKEQMRDYQWNYIGEYIIPISDFPALYARWFAFGMERMALGEDRFNFQSARSVVERASLIQMTLRTTFMAGRDVPFLYGASYAPVPLLLVPRMIVPDKPSSHEGTTILNVHYGLQDREGTEVTTIGWGLMNESYANFGFYGVIGLGFLLGGLMAFIERLGKSLPLQSLRVLYGFFFVGIAINTEATMGVFLTTWFQGTVGLAFLVPLMERRAVSKNMEGIEF
ncbi:hypothetical protein C7S18_23045 [Ahniella affigens]|uniref:Oligosaccharide repeat unit polymerase n=1 Tax=Ahniella affigens TaxID=2021234 RepID=A0A2P1PYG0_9GAMM|nr:hypothetical protein [Ahniella affigens]AVP99876.1 hypothetical protein C7S18_23045 [Ahniella affigens]